MQFFNINTIAFEVLSYPISYVELVGTLFGLISVYYASKANVLTWATGVVNVVCLFFLFFQVQLYSDMLLQVYFLMVTLYGWYNWKKIPEENSITSIGFSNIIWLLAIVIIGTLLAGFLFSSIHLYLPAYFKIEAAYPYTDSFVMVLSIIATVLLAKKKIETWYLWIIVDLVCVVLFFKKGIVFLSIEYFIFLGLATYGLLNWKKKRSHG